MIAVSGIPALGPFAKLTPQSQNQVTAKRADRQIDGISVA